MTHAGTKPQLSPVLLAGLPLRALPPVILQPALDLIMATLRRRHPEVFARLQGIGNPVYEIDPVDLPINFILRMTARAPRLRALRKDDAELSNAGAVIRGPFAALIELLEGRTDGDALFFARRLTIEGDTEAVVALRNALDDAEINIRRDILKRAGPLAPPLRLASGLASRVFDRAAKDLETVRDAILEPAKQRLDGQAKANQELQKRLDNLQAGQRRRPRRMP